MILTWHYYDKDTTFCITKLKLLKWKSQQYFSPIRILLISKLRENEVFQFLQILEYGASPNVISIRV